MIPETEAATEIRRLSRLKNYPRSWESAGSAATEQDAQAEAALIEAASGAPSLSRLRQFVSDWERRHVEAPVPAVLYEAWRGGATAFTAKRRKCGACGDAGWVTRYFVSDCIAGKAEDRTYIGETEVADWWARIRATPTCAQRVYEESVRCGCGIGQEPVDADPDSDRAAYRDFATRAAGERG